MNIVISFGVLNQDMVVWLPDEARFRQMVTDFKRAVDEGKRQTVHIIYDSELGRQLRLAKQVPEHGVIVFNSTDDDEELNVNGEGAWWLYTKPLPIHVQASAMGLKMFQDVWHAILTI